MKLTRALLPIAALLPLAACGATANSTSTQSSSGGGSSGGSGSVTVTAKNISFSPSTVPVSAGQQVTVTFENQDSTTHSLTLNNGGGEAVVNPGSSGTVTFTAPQSGSVAFHCKFHSNMTGSFTVGGSGGSGAGGGSSSSTSSSNGYGY